MAGATEDFRTSDSTTASGGSDSTSRALLDEVNKDRKKGTSSANDSSGGANDSGNKYFGPLEITGLEKEGKPAGERSEHAPEGPASGPEVQNGRVILDTQRYTPDYRGEDIRRESQPTVITDTKGKTLREIAEAHLGSTPPPTEDEIQKHVKELARINHIKKPGDKLEGQPITVPGHDKYGGMITQDSDGNRKHVYLNGDTLFINKDGTGYDRHLQSDGHAYSEHHWGPYPRDNYDIRRTSDSKYEISTDGKNFKEATDAHDPRVERAKLRDVAEGTINDPADRAKFEADMNKFAAREKDLEQLYLKEGMKPEDAHKKAAEETAKTYEQVARLIDAPDNAANPKIKSADRILLAEQVMHQAANPGDVSQGGYGTCNVATVESRAYTRNPSEAARLVADITTTGKYTSNGTPPTTVEVGKDKDIDPDSLTRIGESKNAHENGANHRSYASQVFEVTAVNMHYHNENAANPSQKKRYEQHDPKGSDNGERLYNYSEKDPKTGKAPAEVIGRHGEPERAPGLEIDQLSKVGSEICPDPKKDLDKDAPTSIFLQNNPDSTSRSLAIDSELLSLDIKIKGGVGDGKPIDLDSPEAVKKAHELIDEGNMDDATKKSFHERLDKLQEKNLYDNRDGVAYVRDEKHLNDSLAKFKAEGRLPMIVQVHTGAEPFRTDGGGGHGGQHVVTITDYNPGTPGPPPTPATVQIDNQWSAAADHKDVPVSQLFKAMQRVDDNSRLATVEKEVADLKAAGKVDLVKETELIEAKREAFKLNDKEMQDEIVKMFARIRKDVQDNKVTPENYATMMNMFQDMRRQLPEAEQKKLNARMRAILDAEKPVKKAA